MSVSMNPEKIAGEVTVVGASAKAILTSRETCPETPHRPLQGQGSLYA